MTLPERRALLTPGDPVAIRQSESATSIRRRESTTWFQRREARTADKNANVEAARFEACYEEHVADVYRVCLRYGGGKTAWAEDATHDVFVKLLEHLPTLDEPEDIGGWLYRVAANVSISRLRREKTLLAKLRRLCSLEVELEPPPDLLFEESESAAEAIAYLRKLPALERVILCMKFLDRLSQREIAQVLSISEGYVSKLCARGLERLRAAGWEAIDDA